MDDFKRFLFITTFCFIGLAGCDDNSLSEEQMEERTIESYTIVNSTLLRLNPYFYLADTSISALQLLNAQEGTKKGECDYGGTFTATLNNNILHMELHDCSTPAFREINGVLILELTELEQQGYLLALNGRLSGRNLSYSSSNYKNDNFDAELIQSITGPHRTLTTLNFSDDTRIFNYHGEVIETSNMSYQRQLDYETGIVSIAYDGQVTRFNDEEVSVSITTPDPIELIHRLRFLNGTFIIDDGKSHIKASFSKSNRHPYFFDIETEFNNGRYYQVGNPWAAPFAHKPLILSFTSRNGNLGKFSYDLLGIDENSNIKDRIFYEHLSPNEGHLQSPAEGAAQLGSVSLAVLPIFNNLGQFTVSILDRETNIELNTDLYTVTLDGIWVTISFDSSLSPEIKYNIRLTDDSGRMVLYTSVN